MTAILKERKEVAKAVVAAIRTRMEYKTRMFSGRAIPPVVEIDRVDKALNDLGIGEIIFEIQELVNVATAELVNIRPTGQKGGRHR